MSGISVALVDPEFPLNVGYVARAMANFGLENLYIVSPEKNLDIIEASKFASHGERIIADIRWVKSLDFLKAKFVMVGTTAIRGKRKSNITRKTMEADICATMLSRTYRKLPSSSGICIVFGRDTTGLTNDELRKCDFIVSVTTGSKYNTLNISHAAAIIFYSFLLEFKNESSKKRSSKSDPADSTRVEREKVIALFEELAIRSDFQRHKSSRLKETMQRLLNRSNPSLRELYLLMGIASKATSQITRLVNAQETEQ